MTGSSELLPLQLASKVGACVTVNCRERREVIRCRGIGFAMEGLLTPTGRLLMASIEAAYKLITKFGRSSGSENIGPKKMLWALFAAGAVNRPNRITLDNNEKIRP